MTETIKPTDADLFGYKAIEAQITNATAAITQAQQAKTQGQAALDNYIEMLEAKYDANFNRKELQLEPKSK